MKNADEFGHSADDDIVDAEVVDYDEGDYRVIGFKEDGSIIYGVAVDVDQEGEPVYAEVDRG